LMLGTRARRYRESAIPVTARVTNVGTKVATMKDLKGGSHEIGEIGVTDSGLFGTNLDTGLTKEENERRLGLFGFNELPGRSGSDFDRFWAFRSATEKDIMHTPHHAHTSSIVPAARLGLGLG